MCHINCEIKQLFIEILEKFESDKQYSYNRDDVVNYFGYHFNHLDNLNNNSLRNLIDEFMTFNRNKHWKGLSRNLKIFLDNDDKIDNIRENLKILLAYPSTYKNKIPPPINERIDKVNIKGFKSARLTPILLVASHHPHAHEKIKYGVWNQDSKKGLNELSCPINIKDNEFKNFDGKKYNEINKVLKCLANEFNTDLWFLDYVWKDTLFEEYLKCDKK